MDNGRACVTSLATDAIGLLVPPELDEVHLSVLDAKTLNMQAHRMPAVGTMYYCGSYPDRCHPYWNLFAFQTLLYTWNPLCLSPFILLDLFFRPSSGSFDFLMHKRATIRTARSRYFCLVFDSIRRRIFNVSLRNLNVESSRGTLRGKLDQDYWILRVNAVTRSYSITLRD